jgi:hypothetical protein
MPEEGWEVWADMLPASHRRCEAGARAPGVR